MPRASSLPYFSLVETALLYSEYIAAYIQGLQNTVWVLGRGRCVRWDTSDLKYASTVLSIWGGGGGPVPQGLSSDIIIGCYHPMLSSDAIK